MRRALWIGLAVVAAGAIVFALVYWNIHPAARAPGQTAAATQALESLIVTTEPVVRSFVQRVPWTGVVQSTSTVELMALVAGRVEAVPAADQAPVQAGATVMILGGPLLTAQRARLQANVKSLQAQLALATQTVQALQQSVTQQLATRGDLAAAQAQQLKLEAQLHDAQLELESSGLQTQVVAPITGVFTNRRVNAGQAVKAGDVLGTIIDPNHLRIVASLFPRPQAQLEGKEAAVRITADQTVPGTVRRVLPQANSMGATMVWMEGPQIDRQLRPDQTVAGEMTLAVRASSLAVPESAVLYDQRDQPYVFVEVQGRYEPRGIRPGLTQDGWVEVLSGLQKGESVVTQGAYEIANRAFSSQYRVED